MSPSYGHAYLTSYGWTAGTGLRKGAISKPLAIPPKKNLSGLGKDRDEAFPFWDHVFTAASKAITIRVSSDDEDDPEATENPSSCTDPTSTSVPLRRTVTGIISNRRPVSATPASSSGSTTPNLNDDPSSGTACRPSLMATTKREAAKRGLYARFFRGPVLGSDDDLLARPGIAPRSAPASLTSVDSPSGSAPVPDHGGAQDDVDIARKTKKNRKRKLEERKETKEERRERKRLKKERTVMRAAKRVEKAEKKDRKRERSGHDEQKARKQGVAKVEKEACSQYKKAPKRTRKSIAGSEGGREDTARRSPSDMEVTGSPNVLPTTKKKRKISHSRH